MRLLVVLASMNGVLVLPAIYVRVFARSDAPATVAGRSRGSEC